MLNPDPYEGTAQPPALSDRFWYPVWEAVCELDVPVLIHSAGCRPPARESYSLHFIQEETLAVAALLSSSVLDDFPALKIIVSHGGGAIPYQRGRFQPGALRAGTTFEEQLRKLYYDTCLYTRDSIELLLRAVGTDRCLFGTEKPGTGSSVDPADRALGRRHPPADRGHRAGSTTGSASSSSRATPASCSASDRTGAPVMAEIALGIGTSHGPQLSTPPEEWGQRAAADRRNPALAFRGADYSFDELSQLRGAAFAAECEPGVQARAARAQPRRDRRARPDHPRRQRRRPRRGQQRPQGGLRRRAAAAVRHLLGRHDAARAVHRGSSSPPCRPGSRSPRSRTSRSGPRCGTGHSELGLHLIHEVSRAGFDPGAAKVLPAGRWQNHSIPHGWGFILQQVLGGHDLIPIVPVFVNTFWEPNPPSARRCYDFGVALGAAIECFPADLRVGVVASGGLSHFVIDEELDRAFMKALIDKDREFMAGLGDDLLRSGTSELRNWIVVGGATADTR